MVRRVLILANPAAGRRGGERRLRRVVDALERRGCRVVLRKTVGPGDAERWARSASPDFDVIVAAGGDGTVNEVVNGLRGRSRAMAVLPLGTGNVLANEIGMPRAPERLAAIIAEAPAAPVWPGLAGDRLFVAMTGIGFDAEVLGALRDPLKRWLGKLAFLAAILACLCRHRRQEFVIDISGSRRRAASVIVVKGRRYAGNFTVAPAARLAEPLLHVVVFERGGRLAVLRGLAAMTIGALHRLPGVLVLRTPKLEVKAADGLSVHTPVVEIDGDLAGRLPITIAIAETPLLLVQPQP